jgi:N-acetyl-alpha-D-muramate 1-phosphate uridylyltransferase
MKAMILAAGLGTRLKPFTDHHPKALAQVNGKTLLQRNVEYLASFGIKDIIVNVHHFADQIIEVIEQNKGFGCNISISDERDEVLETGGGLRKAKTFLEGEDAFVLMNADILTDLDLGKMIEQQKGNQAIATLAVTARKTSRYLLFDEAGLLSGWRNEKTGEEKLSRKVSQYHPKAFSGIHVISPAIFSYLDQVPEPKFSIIDTYLHVSAKKDIRSFDHTGSKFTDVGKPESLVLAQEMFA